MTTLNIGPGHDRSKRRVDLDVPVGRTGMEVIVGDSYDDSEVDAGVRVRGGSTMLVGSEPQGNNRAGVTEAESPKAMFARAILLLVAGVAIAATYSVIAWQLPVGLVPLVLLVSVCALYMFALFLVPSSNRSGLRSFGTVLRDLIAAAFAKKPT
jgi:hypothetical protein